MWQDYVLTAGSIVLLLSLFPSIFSSKKPAIATSLSTGLALFVFSLTYFSLSLWFAAGVTLGTSILWLILAIQVFTKRKKD